ncbi:MAG: hypothetical protein IKW85_03750 [Muribaculaceae bacterium]|nr:hypothetical protein [Muribaculaceae bacterium]
MKAQHTPIVIQNGGSANDHSEHFLPADAPEVYLDLDEMEIIIEADGFADYYNVDIFTMAGTSPVLWAVVNGTYDTVDISSLPADDYRIVIYSSNNNVFEGYFSIE